ncbi:MAG: tetratricopeptide repeat protein [Timaviella obliquedivisa GSE-PSE-MK23-08B]|jgi:tetratricopeptide (TPR) repeat protein|nr:tetratricopeptide repeat protein [Timaviella obliquedivisa GSE-PSE-MK23-08B]
MNESANQQNEDAYEELVTVIESSKGTLALLIAVCDSRALRTQIIERYEQELLPNIYTVRLQLNQKEPSLRAAIDNWITANPWVKEQQRHIVLTVTGAEELLWLNLRADDEDATQLDKFYGYLQWTREGLREFPYPIVLWVTRRILRTMSRKSPDFWSWRRGVYRFVGDEAVGMQPVGRMPEPERALPDQSDDFGLALADVQELIAQTEAKQGKDAVSLATLYDRLGQAYMQRIERGEATDLEREKELAIASFQKALELEKQFGLAAEQMQTLTRLGLFYDSQSQYHEAIALHEQSLQIARELSDRYSEAGSLNNIGIAYKSLGQYPQAIEFNRKSLEIFREINNRDGEAGSLNNLGNVYDKLKQYPQAIEFHQQSLEIKRQIGDLKGEAISLMNLGNAYKSIGQYPQAIEFHQQSLEIKRQVGDRRSEAESLVNLGTAYHSLRQYPQAIELYQQSLKIFCQIGDRHGEANSLLNNAQALAKLDNHWQALKNYQQAQQIYKELQLEYMVKQCKVAIYELHQIIAAVPRAVPTIGEPKPSTPDWWENSLPNAPSRPRRSQHSWWQKLWQWMQRLFRRQR